MQNFSQLLRISYELFNEMPCPVCGVNVATEYHRQSHKEAIEFQVPSEGEFRLLRARCSYLTDDRALANYESERRSVGVFMRKDIQASQRHPEPCDAFQMLPKARLTVRAEVDACPKHCRTGRATGGRRKSRA